MQLCSQVASPRKSGCLLEKVVLGASTALILISYESHSRKSEHFGLTFWPLFSSRFFKFILRLLTSLSKFELGSHFNVTTHNLTDWVCGNRGNSRFSVLFVNLLSRNYKEVRNEKIYRTNRNDKNGRNQGITEMKIADIHPTNYYVCLCVCLSTCFFFFFLSAYLHLSDLWWDSWQIVCFRSTCLSRGVTAPLSLSLLSLSFPSLFLSYT